MSDAVACAKFDGEIRRFGSDPAIVKDMELGTARGGETTRTVDVDLRHPLGSPYNFFTWCDQLTDFSKDVILKESNHKEVTLVCNSIGTISSFQAVMDTPDIFNGVFVICPNFRELHSAEVPLPSLSMPVIRSVQGSLRRWGQAAFDALAKLDTVKQILREPYARTDAVDDTLVQVLLDPLLLPGASQVVFDTLSYFTRHDCRRRCRYCRDHLLATTTRRRSHGSVTGGAARSRLASIYVSHDNRLGVLSADIARRNSWRVHACSAIGGLYRAALQPAGSILDFTLAYYQHEHLFRSRVTDAKAAQTADTKTAPPLQPGFD